MSCLSGTLTQFTLVLYGTASASAGLSTPDSVQLPEDGCKTYDLSQICTGKSSTAEIRVPPAAQHLYVQCCVHSFVSQYTLEIDVKFHLFI